LRAALVMSQHRNSCRGRRRFSDEKVTM